MFTVQVQHAPIVIDTPANGRDDCGAQVRFLGSVRNDAGRAPLTSLVLEHFPGVTESEITRIVNLARERWALQSARVVHRVGRITVGETIVLVETASAHRRDAYDANVFIMDYLKTQAPFWKQECFADGHAHWVEAKESDQDAAQRWGTEAATGSSSSSDSSSSSEPARAALSARIGALILAGGEGSRMGYCNKGLQTLHGRPMVAHVLERIRPWADFVAISANHDLEAYQALGVPVFTDNPKLPVQGPLAGLAAALSHFPHNLDAVLVVPCDCPRLPADLVPRLFEAMERSRRGVVVAHTQEDGRLRHQAVFLSRPAAFLGLIPRIHADADHSLMGWLREQGYDTLSFSDASAFVNVNDADTLNRLQSERASSD